ncbi:MAG: branched-chain amino acid ABC transporter substrate-binding protein [Bifidobacteriaceae bacterium]|jgi:branched-chain amino acid transport system substrate-binding protein|nr:branched-chain amino acid ABC transporter substrate-binding protein [Bifidobacteriaceae bacterium]
MTSKNRFQIVLAAAGAAAALTLSGCGGGLGSNSDADKSADADEGAIKLGLLAPFTGSEAAFGPYLENGAKLAIKEINEAGGVLGRQLELIAEDDACDPTAAVAGANKLVTAGVVASVGGYCSGATIPTVDIFAEAKIPMVIPAANANDLVGMNKFNFMINGTGAQQAATVLAYAEHEKLSKVAVLDDNSAYAKDLAKSFVEQATAAGTVQIVLEESVNPDESDYSANVNNVINAAPDLVFWSGYYQEGGLIAKQLHAAGYAGAYLVGDGSVDAKLAEIAGADAAKGIVGTFTQTPDMLQGEDKWLADYSALAGAAPGPYTTQAYDAVRVVAEAIKNAGSTDGEKVVAALEAIDGFDLFSGPLKFTAEHTLSEGGFVVVEITDSGEFQLKANPATDY